MSDQAHDLRRLVLHAVVPSPAPRPGIVAVMGGRGGVGTTTVALQLAVAAARDGLRTLLIDADPRGGSMAVLCGLEVEVSLADVLAARQTIREALCGGPGATRLVPGVRPADALWDASPADADRLLGQLDDLGEEIDLVVLDPGNSLCRWTQPLLHAADLLVTISTPATAAVVGAYELLRAISPPPSLGSAAVLVNMAPSARVAQDIQRRLARTCRRMLGLDVASAGHLPILRSPGPASRAAVRPLRPLVAMAGAMVDGKRRTANTNHRSFSVSQPLCESCFTTEFGENHSTSSPPRPI